MIKIDNNSVYFDRPYPVGFEKNYKGVIIVVDPDLDIKDRSLCNENHFHLSIRNRNKKETIYKTRSEDIHKIIFDGKNGKNCSITCIFDRDKDNKSPETLCFPVETYIEIKENLYDFMKSLGCKFDLSFEGCNLIFDFDK